MNALSLQTPARPPQEGTGPSASRETSFGLVMALWAVMATLNVLYVALFAVNLPYVDDYELLAVLSGFKPLTFEWLWHETINEHRFPAVRAIMWILARQTENDIRATMLLSSLLLSAAGLIAVLALRRARGRASLGDVIVLAFTMSWIHWWNMIQGVGLFFVLFLFLMTIVLSAVHLRFWNSWIGTAVVGSALALLPINAGIGFIAAVALLPYVVLCGLLLWRRRERGDRLRAGMLGLIAGVMLFELSAYVVTGLFTSNHSYTPSVSLGLILSFLKVLSMGMGTVAHALWGSWGGGMIVLMVVFVAGMGGLAVRDGFRRPDDRVRILGYASVFLGVAMIAGGIGVARGGDGAKAPMAYWYATAMAPAPLALYFLLESCSRRPIAGLPKLAFGVIALIALVSSFPIGWRHGWARWQIMTQTLQAAKSVHDPWKIGPRHSESQRIPVESGTLGWGLRLLLRIDQGPYAPEGRPWLAPLPPMEFREIPLVTWRREKSRVKPIRGARIEALEHSLYLETTTDDAEVRLPPLELIGDAGVVIRIEIMSNSRSMARLKGVKDGAGPGPRPVERTQPIGVGRNWLDFYLAKGEYEGRVWHFLPGTAPARYRLIDLSVLELPVRPERVTLPIEDVGGWRP